MSHLKINDTIKMKFRSTLSDKFIQLMEALNEFIRDTATVTIVKGMSVLLILFECFNMCTKICNNC